MNKTTKMAAGKWNGRLTTIPCDRSLMISRLLPYSVKQIQVQPISAQQDHSGGERIGCC
jgi:hypothetical protein